MAKKIKFALEMADGVKVRSGLEELREHFDMEKIAGHFLSGKLLEWLEDRYYDDEAAKIAELDKDAPNLNAQLCAIIGVDASKYDAFDVEALERLNEKKRLLKERTSDSKIIDNAMLTAFTQEDLADLLDLESPVIYLCGEKFNIPIRVEHKKYIGILGTPKIEIRAASNDDLKEKDILFENVILPFSMESSNNIANKTLESTNSNQNNYNDKSINTKTIEKLSPEEIDAIYEKGVAAYKEKDFNTAFECFKRGVEQNDGYAANLLGIMYSEGEGVTKDFNTAVKLFELAANQNIPGGIANLGAAYENGEGVCQNRKKAIKLYKRAACLGSNFANRKLTELYPNRPYNFVGSNYSPQVISIVKQTLYSDTAMENFVDTFESGDYSAKEIAKQLARQCHNYLPMGGTLSENMYDIIFNIEAYIESKR